MLTLKHLAREAGNADPAWTRRMLRNQYGKKGRWRWTERNRDYDNKLKFVTTQLRKKNGKA